MKPQPTIFVFRFVVVVGLFREISVVRMDAYNRFFGFCVKMRFRTWRIKKWLDFFCVSEKQKRSPTFCSLSSRPWKHTAHTHTHKKRLWDSAVNYSWDIWVIKIISYSFYCIILINYFFYTTNSMINPTISEGVKPWDWESASWNPWRSCVLCRLDKSTEISALDVHVSAVFPFY